MQGPLVSVIIPCFNGAASIEICVASLVQQAANVEVVIVDDGSTDDSLSRAVQVMHGTSLRMIIVSQKNQGQAAARNLGLRAASGKYCCFLDVDDELSPGVVNDAMQVLESNATFAAAFGGIELINLHRAVEPWQLASMEDTMLGNLLVRTEIAREIGGFPIDSAFRGKSAGEDGVFRLQVPRFGQVAKLDRPFLRYHVRRGSHVDFFLDRAVKKPGGTVTFTEQSPEEKDGTLHTAFNRFVDGVSAHLLEKVVTDIQRELGGGVEFIRNQQLLVSEFTEDVDLFEAFALYTFCKRWPIQGTTLVLGPAQGRCNHWIFAACKAAGILKLLTITNSSEALSRESWSDPIRLLAMPNPIANVDPTSWLRHVAPFGLVILNRELHKNAAANFAGWKHRVTLQRLVILEKPGT